MLRLAYGRAARARYWYYYHLCVCQLVRELVHSACTLSGREPADHVTLGEFLLPVAQLRHHSPSQR